ncbi:LCP family protein [Amycolatopsis sacchari]
MPPRNGIAPPPSTAEPTRIRRAVGEAVRPAAETEAPAGGLDDRTAVRRPVPARPLADQPAPRRDPADRAPDQAVPGRNAGGLAPEQGAPGRNATAQPIPRRDPADLAPGRTPDQAGPGRNATAQPAPRRDPADLAPGRAPEQAVPGRNAADLAPEQAAPGRNPADQPMPGRNAAELAPGRPPQQPTPGRTPDQPAPGQNTPAPPGRNATEQAAPQPSAANATAADEPRGAAAESASPGRNRTVPPEDRLTMTDELEPIDDSTMVRRKIDHTLARFSAAHDELEAEEAKRKQRLEKLAARPVQLLEHTRTKLQRVVAPVAAKGAPDENEVAPQTRLQEKKKRHNERTVLIGRISVVVLAVLVFLGTGALWGTKTWFNSQFTQIAALDENSSDIQDAPAQLGDENFLIAGSDTRAGATADENVGSADEVEGARSDTVMLAHIPADRKRAVVISFPRDLEITRPPCERFDVAKNDYTSEIVPAASKVKLNTAYAVGGPRCLIKWMQQLTGMKINHFVGIDFSGFKDMVNAVGGVTVHVDRPINDTTLGMVISQTGDVTISGDQALSFVRARHVVGDPTSDYGRIKRQQEFIGALMAKVMSHGVLTNPTQLSDFVTAFAKATFGDNIGVDQMLTLAQSMKGLDPSKVNFMTVPTVGEPNSRNNEVLLESKAKAVFQALINNTALPGSAPPSPPADKQTAGAGKNAADQ